MAKNVPIRPETIPKIKNARLFFVGGDDGDE